MQAKVILRNGKFWRIQLEDLFWYELTPTEEPEGWQVTPAQLWRQQLSGDALESSFQQYMSEQQDASDALNGGQYTKVNWEDIQRRKRDSDSVVEITFIDDNPTTLTVGGFTFHLRGKELLENQGSRLGCLIEHRDEDYQKHWELAQYAWKHQEFDKVSRRHRGDF